MHSIPESRMRSLRLSKSKKSFHFFLILPTIQLCFGSLISISLRLKIKLLWFLNLLLSPVNYQHCPIQQQDSLSSSGFKVRAASCFKIHFIAARFATAILTSSQVSLAIVTNARGNGTLNFWSISKISILLET